MAQVCGKHVGSTGFGLMGLTWRPQPCPTSQAIQTMRTAVTKGATCWNAGEIYGKPEYNSMHIINEYFSKYPEDADKVIINVKSGVNLATMQPDGSEEGVRRGIENCNRILAGKKFLDTFECARVDPKTPVEETMKALQKCVNEKKIGGISLSECSAETVKRAAKVAKIDTVEVEFSLYATDPLKNGVAQACAENGIVMLAYSPLGRGFLAGSIKTLDDVSMQLKQFPRFSPENFDNNLKLAQEVEKIASKKRCTSGQIAIAWVKSFSGAKGMPTIIPIPGATTDARVIENTTDVTLSSDEMKEINDALAKCEVKGSRYGGHLASLMDG
ncbi:MAG: Pyridoxine 4-dehydrogenase [Chrysothrix sp. TS-e1954]|nr:MAG: Pyridoxine 4-dehydrogenase [Chrysothrix sp. TS-e1954]